MLSGETTHLLEPFHRRSATRNESVSNGSRPDCVARGVHMQAIGDEQVVARAVIAQHGAGHVDKDDVLACRCQACDAPVYIVLCRKLKMPRTRRLDRDEKNLRRR
jgi:hypothetical protein